MIDDITTTIKAQLYDRITSPLSGTFAISWAVWNWRFLTVLLSDLKATEKITYISLNIFYSNQQIFLHGIALPLITAIALITIYPVPAKWFYKISQEHKKKLKGIQQTIEDDTPMTLTEASELRHKFREIQYKHELEVSSKTNELTEIKDKHKKAEAEYYTLDEQIRELKSQLSKNRQDHIKLESDLKNAQGRLIHLSNFTLSIIPRAGIRSYDGALTISKPINLSDQPQTTNSPRPAADTTIERALNLKLNQNGLIQQHAPTIFAAESNIYLTITGNPKITLLIGNYSESNIRNSIDSAYTILEKMHTDGIPTQLTT